MEGRNDGEGLIDCLADGELGELDDEVALAGLDGLRAALDDEDDRNDGEGDAERLDAGIGLMDGVDGRERMDEGEIDGKEDDFTAESELCLPDDRKDCFDEGDDATIEPVEDGTTSR